MKSCIHCGVRKRAEEFYRHPYMADGRLGSCKACCRQRAIANRARNIDYYREYDRQRFNDRHRKRLVLEAQRRMRVRLKERFDARAAVARAIRAGSMTKPATCGLCGKKSKKIEAHHEDYGKPLSVEWLCFVCHRMRHGQYAEKARK